MAQQDMDIDDDTETFETMLAGVNSHMFGPAEKGIREQIRASQDLAQDIGSMAFQLTEVSVKQATEAGREVDLDMTFGLATEIIDSLLQIAEAMGVIPDAEDAALREDSLASAVSTYLQVGNPSPEEQEAAKQMLAQMQGEGLVDEAASTLQQMGARRGEDPFGEDAPVDAGGGAPQPAPQPGRRAPALMQG